MNICINKCSSLYKHRFMVICVYMPWRNFIQPITFAQTVVPRWLLYDVVRCRPLVSKGHKLEPTCSLECKYLNSDDYKDLLWTTLSEFPGTPQLPPYVCPIEIFSIYGVSTCQPIYLNNDGRWIHYLHLWWAMWYTAYNKGNLSLWLMLDRTAGDAVCHWPSGTEEDHGSLLLHLLSLHCSTLRLCWEVRSSIKGPICSLSRKLPMKSRIHSLMFLTVFLLWFLCCRTSMTVLIFIARAFIAGGFQAAYVYTPEVRS